MSKVVHLADQAHRRAKEFCQLHGLKMSDWVAAMIRDAIAKGRTDIKARALVAKKRIVERLEAASQPVTVSEEQEVPVYARPPFWAQRSK